MQFISAVLCVVWLSATVSGNTFSDSASPSTAGIPPTQGNANQSPQAIVPKLFQRSVQDSKCRRAVPTQEAGWSNVDPPKTTATKTSKSNPPSTTKTMTSKTTKSSIWTSKDTSSSGKTTRTTQTPTTRSTTPSTTRTTAPSTTQPTSSTTRTSGSSTSTTSNTSTTRTSGSSSGSTSTSSTSRPTTTAPTTTTLTTTTTFSTSTTTTSAVCTLTNRPAPPTRQCIGQSTCTQPEVGCSLQANQQSCEAQCNIPSFFCASYSYNANTNYCILYGSCSCPTQCPAGNRPNPIQKDCQPGQCSRAEVGCTYESNQASCEAQCNVPEKFCIGYNYNPTSGYCVLYGDCQCPTTCDATRPSPIPKDCQPGSCPRAELSCTLQRDQAACQAVCDQPGQGCVAFNYNPTTGKCITYGDCQCPTTCDATRPSPVQKDCQPGFCSRAELSCTLQRDQAACQAVCDQPGQGCIAFNYNAATGKCVTYGDCSCPDTCGTDRPSPIRKDCQPGFCSRREISCSLTNSGLDCQAKCNEPGSGCIGYNYNSNNDYCVLYGDCTCPDTCGSDRPSPVLKSCPSGTCSRRELSCSLASNEAACQANCNNPNDFCIAYNYNSNNDYCVLYGDCTCPAARLLRRGLNRALEVD